MKCSSCHKKEEESTGSFYIKEGEILGNNNRFHWIVKKGENICRNCFEKRRKKYCPDIEIKRDAEGERIPVCFFCGCEVRNKMVPVCGKHENVEFNGRFVGDRKW